MVEFNFMTLTEAACLNGGRFNNNPIKTLHKLFQSILGEGHLDTDPYQYKQLSILLSQQFSPEEIQETIDIGNIAFSEDKIFPAQVYSNIDIMVKSSDKMFVESMNLPPTHKKILCGSASNIDKISYLGNNETAQQKIDKAFQDALIEGEKLGKNGNKVIEEIEDIIYKPEDDEGQLPGKVTTKAEAK